LAKHKMVATVNSTKHYVHLTNTAVPSATVLNVDAVDAVAVNNIVLSQDCREGCTVKAVHFEFWIIGNGGSGTSTQFNATVQKIPVNSASPAFANMINLGAWTNKKNILWSSQGVIAGNIDGAQSVPIVRGWILIPKGKQRMGLSDRIVFSIAATGFSIQCCGFMTYKEYY